LTKLGEPGLQGPGSSTKMGGERVRARSAGAAANARENLDQTIIAAFASLAQAEHARKSLRGHGRLAPKQLVVVKSGQDPVLNQIGEFAVDVRKALADGNAIVIVRLDESDAFEALEHLDQDTRSRWTVAMPPVPARHRG
jgi:hypothetical protein